MTISQAIRKARKEVVFVPTAEVLNGYRQARIHTWSEPYRAWVEGRNTDYQSARMEAADEVVYRSLRLLLPDLDEYMVRALADNREPAATKSGFASATVIERVRAALTR